MTPSVGFSGSQQYSRVHATWRTVRVMTTFEPDVTQLLPFEILKHFRCFVWVLSRVCDDQARIITEILTFNEWDTATKSVPLALWLSVIAVPTFLVTAQFHSWMAHSSSCNMSNAKQITLTFFQLMSHVKLQVISENKIIHLFTFQKKAFTKGSLYSCSFF